MLLLANQRGSKRTVDATILSLSTDRKKILPAEMVAFGANFYVDRPILASLQYCVSANLPEKTPTHVLQ